MTNEEMNDAAMKAIDMCEKLNRLTAIEHLRQALIYDNPELLEITFDFRTEQASLVFANGYQKKVNCSGDNISAMILDIMRHGIFGEG